MTNIYHITHINNLPSIIQAGGLWCDDEVAKGRVEATGIAHQHIKDRRANRIVPLAPGGNLCDYVPFYFAPRSPMLYAIHTGRVEGYQGGQNDIIHLEASIENIAESDLPYVFTDGHAEMQISKFYDNLNDLDKIDWDVMQAIYWRDTIEDMDRRRRRQAEFLVHSFLPLEQIVQIGVRLQTTTVQVQDIIEQAEPPHHLTVIVQPQWYY